MSLSGYFHLTDFIDHDHGMGSEFLLDPLASLNERRIDERKGTVRGMSWKFLSGRRTGQGKHLTRGQSMKVVGAATQLIFRGLLEESSHANTVAFE
jgi:hypothetical protein